MVRGGILLCTWRNTAYLYTLTVLLAPGRRARPPRPILPFALPGDAP
jgi:hypothetical protein